MMGVLEAINWFFNVSNKALDIMLPWVLLIILLIYPIYYLIRGIKKANKEALREQQQSKLHDTLSGTLILFFTEYILSNSVKIARGISNEFIVIPYPAKLQRKTPGSQPDPFRGGILCSSLYILP